MDRDNFLLAIAVIAVLVSFVGFSITYNSVSSFNNFLTGYATDENGTINLTITTNAAVNITHADNTEGSKVLEFGSGSVTVPQTHAYISTNNSGQCVNCNGWNTLNRGFTIVNVGTVDVSLNITGPNASVFIPGGTGPEFQFNFTENESGSCTWNSADAVNNTFIDFNSSREFRVCDNFNFSNANDALNLDFRIVVPYDATPQTNTATIELHYEAV
jgi:hypothetical protein